MGKKRQLSFPPFTKNIEDEDYMEALAKYGEEKRNFERKKFNSFEPLNKRAKRKLKKLQNSLDLDLTNSCDEDEESASNVQNGHDLPSLLDNTLNTDESEVLLSKKIKKIKLANGTHNNGANGNINVIKTNSIDYNNKIIENGNHSNGVLVNSNHNNGNIANGIHKNKSKANSNTKCHLIKKNKNNSSPSLSNGHSNNSFGHEQMRKVIKLDRQTIQRQRKSLPLYEQREGFLDSISQTETLILIGETGSGKTTQIPQYIHEEKLDTEGAICITQPRRVAAITVAKRVADEMGCEIGSIVGYSVRFEDVYCKETKLKFVTDGMLLKEALSDPLLTKYKWIILDEAHERSINTDALFGIVKFAQKRRKQKKNMCSLHIIIMSATMEVDHFHKYFKNSVVQVAEGREHKIEILSIKEKTKDYIITCMQTLTKIQKEAKAQEDVLVFLTGQEEIEYCMKYLESMVRKEEDFPNEPNLKIYPLYAALPYYKQLEVFSNTPPGMRKVIFSTNIAETSVTIPGIKYVIDCGHVKQRSYNATNGFDDLKICKISQAQAWQRAGRAGREGPGICFRTYTDEEYEAMNVQTVPEILRSNLTAVTLRLMAIGIKDVLNFDFIDKPKKENLVNAIENLKGLKAIENIKGINILTSIGEKMAYFPLEPQYSKLIINGPKYACTEEMLTIVSVLSGESVFVNQSNKRDEIYEKRLKFRAMEGDHIELLNVYKAFTESTNKKNWCRKNFLNFRNLSYAENVRRQLSEICRKNNISLVSANGKIEPVLRCLVSGLYKNVAEREFDNKKVSSYKVMASNEVAQIHPGSRLFNINPDYLIFSELVKTKKTYMHVVTEVRPEYLLEFDEPYFRSKHIQKTTSDQRQYF